MMPTPLQGCLGERAGRLRRSAAMMVLAILSLMTGVPVMAAPPAYAPETVLVEFKPSATAAARRSATRAVKATSARPVSARAPNLQKLTLPRGRSVAAAVKALAKNPNVRFAEPDYLLTASATSNDPDYLAGNLWGMYGDGSSPANAFGSQAAEAWATGHTGSRTVYVGIVDTGVQFDHPDLAANIWTNPFEVPGNGIDDDRNGFIDDLHGWDFYNDDASVYDAADGDNHGTHVAGTIGGEGGNGVGVVGVNWSVTMIPAKFLGSSGGYTSDAVRALDYLTDLKVRHGIDLVATSNSWGGGGFSQALLDAINRSGDAGILFIAAAGNDASDTDSVANYPSTYRCTTPSRNWDCVVAVASITSSGGLSSFSNFGAGTVDLGAPGSSIRSTVGGSSYATYSGTSMATPHVSGAAALCAAADPTWRGAALRDALLGSVTATSSLAGRTATGGRLNVGALMDACLPAATLSGGPADVLATASAPGEATVQWRDAASNETGFEIQRDVDCGGAFASAGSTAANATRFVDTGLANSTRYCYRVRAVGTDTVSAWSAPVAVETQPAPEPYACAATTYEWIDMTGGDVLALGDDAQAAVQLPFAFPFYGASVDAVQVSSNGFLRLGAGAATAFGNAAIPAAAEPNAFVAPWWDDLDPSSGGSVRVRTLGTIGSRQWVVAWEDVPAYGMAGNGLSFQVVLDEATGAIGMAWRDVVAGSTSVNGGASATIGIENVLGSDGTQIGFNEAILTDGLAMRCSNAGGELPPPPPAPDDLAALALSSSEVALNWSDVAGETGYILERAVSGGSFQVLDASIVAGTTNYQDTRLSADTDYAYRIRAFNDAGESADSNIASVTTPGQPPSAPTRLSASFRKGKVTVSWRDTASDETGFDVGRQKRAADGSWSGVDVIGAPGANVTRLIDTPAAGIYRYLVRSRNGSGVSAWVGPTGAITVR